jgi:methylated-DNA-[protein]-cysteine S-methyltransferase
LNYIDNINEVMVSTYKSNKLYFSVGITPATGKIVRISLPKQEKKAAMEEITKYYPNFEVSDQYVDIAKTISRMYQGKKTDLNIDMLNLRVNESYDDISPVKTYFMRNVLLETYEIPFGEVRTYKFLAEKLKTRAYRAVGTALGNNPFPMVIPCHRVVKSDLTIGQYAGGSSLKKEILKNEGVSIKGNKILK